MALFVGAPSVTARAVEIVTKLLIVAVGFDALAPVVVGEVSVTVALMVYVPEAVGTQLTTKGDDPVAIPILAPFTVTAT